jgi:putative flippase GtrA
LNQILKYGLFVCLAISVNLLVQYLVFGMIDSPFTVYFALAVGTVAGLVLKYVLDKNYIFYDNQKGASNHVRKFSLYAFTGVFTTILFWGVELGFHHLLPWKGAQYLGGFLGLSVGYTIKYFLDRNFVFCPKSVEKKAEG